MSKNKIINFILNIIPILIMIGLIPVIQNDYILTVVYIGIIFILFFLKKEKGDFLVFILGFFMMILSEIIFVSTGVETFVRNTLFGLMPLWLPFLWGYGFVVIKRGLRILEQENQKPKIGLGIMIFKDGKVLIGKRKGSHGAGEYSFPGGHLEYMEGFEECARREVLEETGMKIKNIKFQLLGNIKDYTPKHYIQIGLIADWESGEPKILEPNKCESWGWYDIDNLPEPIFIPVKYIIKAYKTNQNYFDSK
jgi:8-oxo-dGTP diphosphatase